MVDAGTEQRIQTYCALCIARCGAIAVVKNGRLAPARPRPRPSNRPALCAKGRAAPELVYHQERLTHPLRRTRPKGDPDPGWERDQLGRGARLTAAAMRRIADRHGPKRSPSRQSSPSTTAIGRLRRLRSAADATRSAPRTCVRQLDVCGWGRGVCDAATPSAWAASARAVAAAPCRTSPTPGCLILWGYNPTFSRLTHATATVDGAKTGHAS